MRLITLKSRVSTLSMILGTLTVMSISTQKTDAAITWSKTECKVRCNKYMAGNMKKNLNECARNCDNGDIKDILIKNCAVLEDKQKLNDALSKQKLGYEGEKQANQKKIDQFKNASDYRGKKLTKEYNNTDKLLDIKIKAVEDQMKQCPVAMDVATPAITAPAGAPAVPPVPTPMFRPEPASSPADVNAAPSSVPPAPPPPPPPPPASAKAAVPATAPSPANKTQPADLLADIRKGRELKKIETDFKATTSPVAENAGGAPDTSSPTRRLGALPTPSANGTPKPATNTDQGSSINVIQKAALAMKAKREAAAAAAANGN